MSQETTPDIEAALEPLTVDQHFNLATALHAISERHKAVTWEINGKGAAQFCIECATRFPCDAALLLAFAELADQVLSTIDVKTAVMKERGADQPALEEALETHGNLARLLRQFLYKLLEEPEQENTDASITTETL